MYKKILTVMLLFLTILPFAVAQQTSTQITIRVDGLSCPFCAYGLEKKLKKLAGVENVRIDVEQGTAEMIVPEGKTIREAEIQKAVSDAGFTYKEITYNRSKSP